MSDETQKTDTPPAAETPQDKPVPTAPKEIGAPRGPEPTRHGEWEVNGRVVDF